MNKIVLIAVIYSVLWWVNIISLCHSESAGLTNKKLKFAKRCYKYEKAGKIDNLFPQ
jgi:hypothetical protein